jgi:hypothetical protein
MQRFAHDLDLLNYKDIEGLRSPILTLIAGKLRHDYPAGHVCNLREPGVNELCGTRLQL